MYLNVEKRKGEDVVNAEVICKIWIIEREFELDVSIEK